MADANTVINSANTSPVSRETPTLAISELPEVLQGFTPKQCRMAQYLAQYDGNVLKAARLAGYAVGDHTVQGSSSHIYQTAQSPRMQEAVAYYREMFAFDTHHYTPEKLTRLYETWASINLADVCDDNWELKPKSQWTLEQQQALIGIEVTLKGGKRFVKPKFAKLEAAEMLARFQKMLVHEKDVSQVQGFNLTINFAGKDDEVQELEVQEIGHMRIKGEE
jgi:hypothetical protein